MTLAFAPHLVLTARLASAMPDTRITAAELATQADFIAPEAGIAALNLVPLATTATLNLHMIDSAGTDYDQCTGTVVSDIGDKLIVISANQLELKPVNLRAQAATSFFARLGVDADQVNRTEWERPQDSCARASRTSRSQCDARSRTVQISIAR